MYILVYKFGTSIGERDSRFPGHFFRWNTTSMLQVVPFWKCPVYINLSLERVRDKLSRSESVLYVYKSIFRTGQVVSCISKYFFSGNIKNKCLSNDGIALRSILINQYNINKGRVPDEDGCAFFWGRCVDVCVWWYACLFEIDMWTISKYEKRLQPCTGVIHIRMYRS